MPIYKIISICNGKNTDVSKRYSGIIKRLTEPSDIPNIKMVMGEGRDPREDGQFYLFYWSIVFKFLNLF